MGFKKLVYILFIFLISVLHTLTLTTWLAKDSNIAEVNGRSSLENSVDSVLASKRNISAIDLDIEINQLNK